MRKTELAWAAGFFDGDGSSMFNRANKQLRMEVGQSGDTCPVTLDRILNAVEVGVIYGPYSYPTKDGANRKPRWVWSVVGREPCREAATKLWPYLSEPKRAQIVRAGILEEEG